jgi:hypothetical protein
MLEKEQQITDEKNYMNSDKTQNREKSQKFGFIISLRSTSGIFAVGGGRRRSFFAFLLS